MTAFHVPHSSVEISPSAPRQQPPMRIRFLGAVGELEQALVAMVEFADPSTPLERRRALRDAGARGFRLDVEGRRGEHDAYFVRAPNGDAAPLMRELDAVSFGLYPA